jgi:hypothetical protein
MNIWKRLPEIGASIWKHIAAIARFKHPLNSWVFVAGISLVLVLIAASTDRKIERLLQLAQNVFHSDDSGRVERSTTPTQITPLPAVRKVVGGWLEFTIDVCHRQGTATVGCDGRLENKDRSDRALATFVTQTSGIRSTIFDKFGFVSAIDNHANAYTGARVRVANRTSNESGQFGFTLVPNLPTPFSVYFDKVDSAASSFVRIKIPCAEGATSSGALIEIVAENVPIN